jgi:hypothetical protein
MKAYSLSPVIRQCVRCKQDKPLSEFSKNKFLNGGYQVVCRKCVWVRRNEREKQKRLERLTANFNITEGGFYICRVCGIKYGSRLTAAKHIKSEKCPRNWS